MERLRTSAAPFALRWILVVVTLGQASAFGQPIFSAREFLFTRQFKAGMDVWPDLSGPPMALHPTGIYVAGAFQLRSTDFEGALRRYDASATEIWTRAITADEGAFPSAIAVDATSIYLIGPIGFGRRGLFVRRYDELGAELWSRSIQWPDGALFLAGSAADASGLYVAVWDGRTDGLVRKYSHTGAEVWTSRIVARSLRGVALDATGLYVSGMNDAGGFLSKYSLAGEPAWTSQLSSSGGEIAIPSAIATDSSGIYVTGSAFQRTADGLFIPESREAFVHKIGSNGTEQWARRVGGASEGVVVSIAVDVSGIYLAGETEDVLPGQCKAGSGDVFIRRYDSTGKEEWTRQFGTTGRDSAGNLALDSTGVYLSGASRGGTAHGSVFVVKVPKTQPVPDDSRPRISWECVVNAASYAGGAVAPGEIVTIFGRGMGPSELMPLRIGEDGRLATSLSGTRILFNGTPAPLVYVSATQSSAIVPYALAGSATAQIEVEHAGVRSEPLTMPVAASRPGIFTLNGTGKGQGAILNEDGSLNSPENPAALGSIVAIFVTGEGLVDPAVPDGVMVRGAPPKPLLPVAVSLEDVFDPYLYTEVEVVHAAAVPESVAGLLQINVRLRGYGPGGNVPIHVRIGEGLAESGVTVAVR
jgi:uncharacterized protein (TIGR03437 family)